MHKIVLSLLFFAALSGRAQTLVVAPEATDSKITQINSPHFAIRPELKANDRLLITLGGTNSRADELAEMQSVAANMGYHVMGIDYPNRVITTICRQAADRECFDKFRGEIMFGAPVSSVTEVNPHNCILNRIEKLLSYLDWQQFLLAGGEVDWSKVVLLGYSQGSGHAAYLAKLFAVERVILLAGPQDFSNYGAASWLSQMGQTRADRFFALLHGRDPFGSEWQLSAVRGLVGDANASYERIDLVIPDSSDARIFVSEAAVPDPHRAVITSAFAQAWAFLLRRL